MHDRCKCCGKLIDLSQKDTYHRIRPINSYDGRPFFETTKVCCQGECFNELVQQFGVIEEVGNG